MKKNWEKSKTSLQGSRLRQDLKKRRGIVQKAGSDEVPVVKPKKTKTKSKKPRDLDFAEDKK
jgi:hypothetical protein